MGWRLIAVSVAGVFFALATRIDVDIATSPRGLSRLLLGPEAPHLAPAVWTSLHFWLRKSYSVVAFALVGFSAHRACGPSARAVLRASLLGGLYSLAIEFAQRRFVAPEPLAESLFDVACGAFGGYLAIVAERAWRQRAERTSAFRRPATAREPSR